MKKIKRIPITVEGYDKLIKDLKKLEDSRPQAVDTLSDARKLGDLSENALYTAAKMRLRSIDSQIFRIKIQIKLADIIKSDKSGLVSLGSKVLVSDGEIERELYLVGQYEADPFNGKISANSPLGKNLIGRVKGESIEVNSPSGKIKYKILKII